MNLYRQFNLLPRNYWDYGLSAVRSSLVGAFRDSNQAPNIEKIFQQKPIWTKSGRASLYAILKSLELPEGTAVGVPLFCCSAVFNAIRQANLTPRFLDSNMDDFNISVDDLRKKRAGLGAVVAVHMFGNLCDMDAINSAAGSMPVIEDCALSIFSTYKGRLTGLLSTASFFSFRAGKYISAGEGSAIICRDEKLQAKIERVVGSFKSCSRSRMFFNVFSTFVKAIFYNRPLYGMIGYPVGTLLDKKYNLTAKDGFETGKIAPTHLSLINARITHLQEKVNKQGDNARKLLETVEPVKFCLPSVPQECSTNWYQFPLRFQSEVQRDKMADYLFRNGIDTAKYLDTITDEVRSTYDYQGDCPKAEQLSKTVLLVPIHYSLSSLDIEHIARSINEGSRLI